MKRFTLLSAAFVLASLVAADDDFIRGNADGVTHVLSYETNAVIDATFLLDYLFEGGTAPECMDAADANDDGAVDMSDVVYLLEFGYNDGPAPPFPWYTDGCDADPTPDSLDCETYSEFCF